MRFLFITRLSQNLPRVIDLYRLTWMMPMMILALISLALSAGRVIALPC
uniref:Ubiquitin ligase protein COP1 n=1 Tax=Arundo donax TaxID=35708 RepID=A0A0A9EER3_ARUDO